MFLRTKNLLLLEAAADLARFIASWKVSILAVLEEGFPVLGSEDLFWEVWCIIPDLQPTFK